MNKILLFAGILTGSLSFGQTQLYQNTFEGAPGFNINTTAMGGVTNSINPFIVNNVYAGGAGTLFCIVSLPFTVPASATQPGGITNSPTSTYLHSTPQIAIDDGGPTLPCASFVTHDGICQFGGNYSTAEMTTDFSTVGYDSVSIDLWWMCGGATDYYGEVMYSTDMGSTWNALTCPTTSTTQWRNESSWVNDAITDANLDGQPNLRLGFRFYTGVGSSGTDPGFAIDDIEITGYTLCAETTNSITEIACDSYVSPSGNYTWTTSNTYMDTIPNFAGCDSVITVDLTINTADSSVTPSGMSLMANAASASYQWLDCDNSFAPVAGATAQTYNASNGNFAVEVTENGCVDTSSCYTIAGLGFGENELNDVLKLYPNPTDDNIFLEFSQSFNQIEVWVRNIEGKIIARATYSESGLLPIQLPEANGMYILEVNADGLRQHYRVVKQ